MGMPQANTWRSYEAGSLLLSRSTVNSCSWRQHPQNNLLIYFLFSSCCAFGRLLIRSTRMLICLFVRLYTESEILVFQYVSIEYFWSHCLFALSAMSLRNLYDIFGNALCKFNVSSTIHVRSRVLKQMAHTQAHRARTHSNTQPNKYSAYQWNMNGAFKFIHIMWILNIHHIVAKHSCSIAKQNTYRKGGRDWNGEGERARELEWAEGLLWKKW